MNAICLVLDHWHSGLLGPYGNTWIDTPWLNRLAWQGVVADRFLAGSAESGDFCRSAWMGSHPLAGPRPTAGPSLPDWLAERGIRSVLLTDAPEISTLAREVGFASVQVLPEPKPERVADRAEETHLMHSMAEAAALLGSLETPFFVWVHLSSLGHIWDAPLNFRRPYVDADDPEPGDSALPAQRFLEADFDPDVVLAASQAYAGQVTLFDQCLGGLLALLDEDRLAAETMLLVAGSRGFPLGEHGRLGPCDDSLYAELVHLPLIVRFPGGLGAALRTSQLLQPADIHATLVDWFDRKGVRGPKQASRTIASEQSPERQRVAGPATGLSLLPIAEEEPALPARDRLLLVERSGAVAIRTPAWYLRSYDDRLARPVGCALPDASRSAPSTGDETRSRASLFCKPDDRWEVNDVADRCADIVQRLEALRDEARDAIRSARTDTWRPLEEDLANGLD